MACIARNRAQAHQRAGHGSAHALVVVLEQVRERSLCFAHLHFAEYLRRVAHDEPLGIAEHAQE